MVLCQIALTVTFFIKSRRLPEVNWLPKTIMVLAIVIGIRFVTLELTEEFFDIEYSTTTDIVFQIVVIMTYPFLVGLLIRFQRVQVQLRAQEENTLKILSTIKYSNIMEKFFVISLVFSNICLLFSKEVL